MKVKKYTKAFAVVFTALLMAVILTVTAMAEIKVENGTVVGLDPAKNYQYAQVTLANYNAPTYNDVAAGSTKIAGLDVGLWYVYCIDDAAKTAIWIEGDPEARSSIGDVYNYTFSDGVNKDIVRRADGTSFIAGVWTGTEARNHSSAAFTTYYLSGTGAHISSTITNKIEAGTARNSEVIEAIQKVVFKYAYASDEIIPVSELFTMTFSAGVRQGSILPTYTETANDPVMKTKYVLYTMDENGKVSTHEALFGTNYINNGTRTTHSISIAGDFPDAKGWVIGIEIYPYGSIPTHGLSFGVADRWLHNGNMIHTSNCYFIDYNPKGYVTKHNSGATYFPVEYNGANTSYIMGMGDGTFAPDKDITKTEMSTILARLLLGDASIPKGSNTRFSDLSVSDWYYDAVNYLESRKVFDYVSGTRLNANKPLTRGEMVQMIQTIAKIETDSKASFKDVDESHPYYSAICAVESLGVINGYADGTFRPDDTITRAEAVTVINRMLHLVADDKTVVENTLENVFTDIQDHWAKEQILIASNDNVKSAHHLNAKTNGLTDNGTSIIIENDHVKIEVNKKNGKVTAITNKKAGRSSFAATTSPWFTYLLMDTGVYLYPVDMKIVDNRLEVTYSDSSKAYFIVDVQSNYFTFELDSEISPETKYLYFCNLTINEDFVEDVDSYRISAVAMNANTYSTAYPGGKTKAVSAYVMGKFGGMGGKLGVTFSRYGGKIEGEHRAYLKEIVDVIDPTVGLTSTHGGPYTLDKDDVFGDYVIPSSGISASTAQSIADTLEKYSIDQIDIHQSGSTFIQGGFNFKCAALTGETFTTAAQFKERVGNIITSKGAQMGLHTYSSLVSPSATNILSDPKWQRQLSYEEDYVVTLAADVTADAKTFLTNEDASGLVLYGSKAGGGIQSMPWSGPNSYYFLIDEEIITVSAVSETGLLSIGRGQCGTTKAEHKAGAEIRHLFAQYSMFQPIPGSELFYHIADLTAKAYNEGGFEMIYLDGLESFARSAFCSSEDYWYYYSTFIQRIVSQCDIDPIIEGSNIGTWFWAARGRGGAVDNATRQFKKYNYNHAMNNDSGYHNYFYTSTLGWFNYSVGTTSQYRNTQNKTLFVDDLDHMGSLGIAFDMSTVYNHQLSSFTEGSVLSRNALHFNLYSRLRKAHYFSPAVKEVLKAGYKAGKEYKLEEQSDESWAFREMTYVKNRIFDMADNTFITGSATNPYGAQTPYIRIEQRYSTLGENEQVLYDFDNTVDVKAGTYDFTETNLTSKKAFKINVTGNGIEGSAILLSLRSSSKSETGRLDFFVPTHFTGTREFILMDIDNADYDGYTFSGVNISSTNYEAYRNSFYFTGTNSVKVFTTGDCTGVKIDDLRACTMVAAPAENPSVTIGNNTITFNATLNSGEYLEYYPELGEAYHHYNGESKYNSSSNNYSYPNAEIRKITFEGSVSVPSGDFTYTYSAKGTTEAPLRAQVVIGLKSDDVIANEDGWKVPTVVLPEDIQYSTIK